ncbi:MAG TPA: aspartyl protease family protein [Vicinamibacterales bacterium]|nr:aspartyl protease family protein [Vicinamibacterales bacterium]
MSLTVVTPAAGADRTRPDVPLVIDARGGIAVPVFVNGAGPFTFILDTGASRTIVADDLARLLETPVVARSEVVTSAGSDVRPVVRLASLALASARAEAVLAPVLPAGNLARLGRGVRGLLGQDFLSAFNYTLDYRRSRLTWDEALTCDAPGAVRMTAAEGRFVVVADADRGPAVRLVPDSGAEVAVLFRGRVPRRPVSRLRIGGVTLDDVPVAIVDREDPNADGLLPLHGFGAVSFAAGGSCLIVRR